jgi:hypothetical protein
MNVFIDLHALGFKGAFYKLFVERLNYNLYIPVGKDWFIEGYWYLFKHFTYEQMDQLANQFLLPETTPTLLKNECPKIKFITLDEFKNQTIKFDIIIASVPHHYPKFEKLITDFNLNSKLIFHSGNNFHHDDPDVKNVKNLLTSAVGPYKLYSAVNKVFYHHEMDTSLYCKKTNCNPKSVVNLQHCMDDFDTFSKLEKTLSDWDFKAYGGNNRDGILPFDLTHITLQNIGFLFHVKKADEGYGMMIHSAFACGTPVITDTEYMSVYYDKSIPNTASLLFNNDTIIDIKKLSIKEIVYLLEQRSDNYQYYSDQVYKKFKEVIDFDEECNNIKLFIEKLI